MSIPESQLETWSHQGAITTAKATHESIRKALDSSEKLSQIEYEVYLQGSYRNNTNIRGDSDVDIVVQLNSAFQYDITALTESERKLFKQSYSNATYLLRNFRSDVLDALKAYYDVSAILMGNKSLKISGGSGRLSADVVVCLQYRKYQTFRSIFNEPQYIEGIIFYTLRENRCIINYPKLHYENGVKKNDIENTNGGYKPIVRIFKNVRTYLVNNQVIAEDIAPSYFLECLLYNVPNRYFKSSYQETYQGILDWLVNSFLYGNYQKFLCQNEQMLLFDSTPEQWALKDSITFLGVLAKLWEGR